MLFRRMVVLTALAAILAAALVFAGLYLICVAPVATAAEYTPEVPTVLPNQSDYIAQLETRLAALEQELAQMEPEKAALQELIAERDARIGQLEESCAAQTLLINQYESEQAALQELVAERDAQIGQLQERCLALDQVNGQLSVLVEEYRAEENTEYVLVIRHEDTLLPGLFGGSLSVNYRVQEITVSKRLYESCDRGDDITNSSMHRLLSGGSLAQTRTVIEDKYIR